jgi:hypothetical protein
MLFTVTQALRCAADSQRLYVVLSSIARTNPIAASQFRELAAQFTRAVLDPTADVDAAPERPN